jgi:hypothetical protein
MLTAIHNLIHHQALIEILNCSAALKWLLDISPNDNYPICLDVLFRASPFNLEHMLVGHNCAMTPSIMTFSQTTLSIKILFATLCRISNQQNNTMPLC